MSIRTQDASIVPGTMAAGKQNDFGSTICKVPIYPKGGIVHKTVVASGDGLEFVLSDATPDRMGDIIEPSGWVLSNFKRNPIALFGHNSSFPVGTWSNLRVESGKLIAKLNLAMRGTSARIDELISLVEQGILRAVSVGFRPIQSEPIDEKKPYDGTRFLRQELVETSLVAVPANPNALQLAKSLRISPETLSIAFGEHADVRRKDVATKTGEQAAITHAVKAKAMITLAQRIEDTQNDIVAKRDKLTELTSVDELDTDAIVALNDALEKQEQTLAALKSSEAKIGINVTRNLPALSNGGSPVPAVSAPATLRRPLGFPQHSVKAVDLITRAILVRGCAHFGSRSIDNVLDERYPGHEATWAICKTDQTVGTTTVSGWASELVRQSWAEFLQALIGFSIYPALRDRGIGLSFDGVGTINLPSRTAGGAGGGFVAEGAPIRVGRVTTASTTMTPFKLGVIIPFTRELAKRSTPAIEALVRQAVVEDTATILDTAILDANAASTARPAGLLNGLSAVASGFGGGDFQAIVSDFSALLAPFYAANAADNITVVMNPAQGLKMALTPNAVGNFDWASAITDRLNVIESTHATAGRLIALRNSDFATALGDAPEFDISESATVHMEDTTPLEIVSGTGPTTADPVRSFYQTATIGVRMLMDISWKMRRTGMVQWIDGTSW